MTASTSSRILANISSVPLRGCQPSAYPRSARAREFEPYAALCARLLGRQRKHTPAGEALEAHSDGTAVRRGTKEFGNLFL